MTFDFFSELFGVKRKGAGIAHARGDGSFAFAIAEADADQRALGAIAGAAARGGTGFACTAALFPDPHHRYDRTRVGVAIDRRPVGHIDASVAGTFLADLKQAGFVLALADARIVAQNNGPSGGAAPLAVVIDLARPFRFVATPADE